MPSANAFQTNFSAGELSPRLYARVDVGKYMNGCQTAVNVIAQRYGGMKKRGGTEFIREAKNSAAGSGDKTVRLVPFVPSVSQAYMLEFGDEYIRIYTNGGIVESMGSPVEVATPYQGDDLFELQFAQSADVLYIAHPDYAPRQFRRTDATTFTLETVVFEDGPYLEINTTSTRLTPASRGAITSIAGSATATVGTAANAFDGDNNTDWGTGSANTGTVTYTLSSGTAVCDAYYIRASSRVGPDRAPSAWEFQGLAGSSWVTLDTRQAEIGWSRGEIRFYEFANKAAYSAYRLVVQGSNYEGGGEFFLSEVGMAEAGDGMTPFNLTASSTTGINDGQGFLTTDVGRTIRLLGSDGRWRWARIAARSSSTVVTIRLYGHAFPGTTPITAWRFGAWSDGTGWPACVGFYSGRLGFAATEEQPQTVWLSVVDDFPNFGISDPLQDDDAITLTIASDSLNEVKWIAEGTDLFLGTTQAIRTIGPTSTSAAFSPTNLRQKRENNYAASTVQPVRVGNTAIYAGYYRKDIREISYSFDFNGYISQNLSILSEHIPAGGIKEMAYMQDPDSVVWACDDDGALFGMTYERDQEVIAFHRHSLGGTGATIESVAVIPGTGSDEVWLVVKRTVNSVERYYLERITAGLSDTGVLNDATYLDCHLTYSGTSTSTLTGLSHLNGESVYVWSNVGQQGPFTVSGGSITLTSAVTKACVGYRYTAAVETLSPEAAARGGTAQTRLGRISEVYLRLDRSMGGRVGPADGTLEPLEYTQSIDIDNAYGVSTALYTGDVRVPIAMEWERGKRIRIEQGDPTPFHLLGLISEIRVSG